MSKQKLLSELPLKLMSLTAAGTLFVSGVVVSLFFLFGVIQFSAHHNPVADTTSGSSATASSGNTNQITIPTQSKTQLPTCSSYQTIDSRTWLEIAKDPNTHTGECLTIYGKVTQFDAATGANGFRANIGGVAETPEYGFVSYPTNTTLVSSSDKLSDVVEGDLFTANVMVLGAYTYDTQIGGQTTVPQLQIDSIQVTGSLSS